VRHALAWIVLTAGIAALFNDRAGVACLGIIGWLVLLGDARTTRETP
jgi:hypothetical protein